jgi:hypothetical protein
MTEQFSSDVRRLFELQDEMKEVRDSIKERSAVLRSDLASTDAAVKKYMLENGVDVCNFQGHKLQLHIVERPVPLTRALMKSGLVLQVGEAEAERLMLAIVTAAGTKRVATLRRARKPAARAAAKPRAPRANPRRAAISDEIPHLNSDSD